MAKKLLVIIDAQKDFVEGGALPYGYPKESITKKVFEYAGEWIIDKDSENHLLVATKDTHDSDYLETLEGKNLPVKHCVKETPGWEFADKVIEGDGIEWHCDDIIFKPTFGTFGIKEYIEDYEKDECEKIDEIQVCGFDTSICVLANCVILRAAFPNKKIVLLEGLCGDVNEESHKAAIAVLKNQQIEIA